MGKFSFKCITKDATLDCTFCSGVQTTFMAPVPNQPITKEKEKEIAVVDDTTITPFTSPCRLPGASPPPPCVPSLMDWMPIDKYFKTDSKAVLLEKSLNMCMVGGVISINDKKQDIISVDLAGVILKAIQELKCMLDYRLDQYNTDKAAFDSDFDHYFGAGHTEADKQLIVDRMNNIDGLIGNMTNADGTLNENYFDHDFGTDNYGVYAYVYPNDANNTIYICPNYFSESTNLTGFDSMAGTIGHEASHFTNMGGTTDRDAAGNLVYGRPDARNLAITDPAQALIHADSFEFFLESGQPCTP